MACEERTSDLPFHFEHFLHGCSSNMQIQRTSSWSHQPDPAADSTKRIHWIAIGLNKEVEIVRDRLANAPDLKNLVDYLPPSGEAPTGVGESLAVYPPASSNLPAILFYGLGESAKFSPLKAFEAATSASKTLASKPGRSVTVVLADSEEAALIRGWIVGTKGPGLRKKEANRHPFGSLTFLSHSSKLDDAQFKFAVGVGHSVNLARELGNTTPDEKCPERLAEKAAVIASAAGCEVEVWDEQRIRAERFGGLLGVAAGSARPPRFVILRYNGAGADSADHYSIVGKGVTFDSGGLSLKPSASMEDMKNDMTGAAVALSVISRLAESKVRVNVVAYMPITENMTGGLAVKLGDVLTMRDGTTVEILNTDAEGRLILADALAYAAEQKPVAIVDLATLTGACVVALGNRIAGLFSNDDQMASDLSTASSHVGERLWRMPIDDDFKDQLKSTVSDLKNVGTRWGGAITAAKFLQHFVGDCKWTHLDIAGPSWSDSESSTRDAGGTGCYVATLVDWLTNKAL